MKKAKILLTAGWISCRSIVSLVEIPCLLSTPETILAYCNTASFDAFFPLLSPASARNRFRIHYSKHTYNLLS